MRRDIKERLLADKRAAAPPPTEEAEPLFLGRLSADLPAPRSLRSQFFYQCSTAPVQVAMPPIFFTLTYPMRRSTWTAWPLLAPL